MKKDSNMKVVILAGGFGTRLSEETYMKPKPMIEIGEHPILWHIMKYYSAFDYNRFIICLGYKGYMIKEYFANYLLHQLARARANDGLIGGHDYTPDYESMMFAVNEFAEQTGLELHSVFPDWWFIVRDEKH